MNFQHPLFLIFFLLILIFAFTIHRSKRWMVLLAGSLVFYASLGIYALFLPLAIVIFSSYYIGKAIGEKTGRKKQNLLWLGIGIQLITLVFFRALPRLSGWMAPIRGFTDLVTAVGVSYYVFQAIGYLVDVYLERIEPEQHLGIYACFITFFPRMIQGPIERGGTLLPQLHAAPDFDYELARKGAIRFLYGLFKKVVIADRLALMVDPVYADVNAFSGLFLWAATIAYAFQLYYDFSGYTDMALGVAQILQIKLSENFNLPYLANSIPEFWRRWHMSFSRWIMDYLFTPLQLAFRKIGKTGVVLSLLITFAISGLWHGFTAGYLAWGLLQGAYLGIAFLIDPARKKLEKRFKIDRNQIYQIGRILFTFGLVCLGWVFFRAESLADAGMIISRGLPWNWLSADDILCTKIILKTIPDSIVGLNRIPEACESLLIQRKSITSGFSDVNSAIFFVGILLLAWFGFRWNPVMITTKVWYWRWLFYIGMVCFILFSISFKPVPINEVVPYLYGNY